MFSNIFSSTIMGSSNGSTKSKSMRDGDDNYDEVSIERRKQISVRGITQIGDVNEIKSGFNRHLHYTLIKDRNVATTRDYYMALANCVKDHIASRWIRTQQMNLQRDPKRVYYLSMEYNMGRFLQNTMINLGIEDACDEAMYQLGLDIEQLEEMEGELHLSNDGMGRLSACFLDSMASLNIPAYGYGIRYNCGAFTQKIKNGEQCEEADDWLLYGNPWEIPRPEYLFAVQFYGKVVNSPIGRQWIDTEVIHAIPYDYPIPGFKNNVVNTLRLWSAISTESFNLKFFNNGDYIQAIFDRTVAENITRVMYPSTATKPENLEIRLKQEFFLCSATIQDILRRYKCTNASQEPNGKVDFEKFAEKNVIQLNKVYSTWLIPEMIRILIDLEHLSWDSAWKICKATCAFTSHNILSETLEKWPIHLIAKVLPRHMEILYQINFFYLEHLKETFVSSLDKAYGLSCIINECFDMSKLAVLGTSAINGLSKFHSNHLKTKTYQQLYEMFPEKFFNITSGITPRRWLYLCNQGLANVISEKLGDKWPIQLEQLEALRKLCRDHSFTRAVATAKHDNKIKLIETIRMKYKIDIDPYSLFDVQVHRIHERKRQLLNCLHIITLYNRIKYDKSYEIKVGRTIFIGGKAEPGDRNAKQILKLISAIALVVNSDPVIGGRLKVVVLENYNVTLAEEIIPCADLSQNIALPGSEACGTNYMKFMLNGALVIASVDGANAEIISEVGRNNIFVFGLNLEEIQNLQTKGYDPSRIYTENPELKNCLDQIRSGYFSPLNVTEFKDLVDRLLKNDKYFVLADYADYIRTQEMVVDTFLDRGKWNEMVVRNIAVSGRFSMDRSVKEYAKHIWHVEPSYEAIPPSDI